MPKNIWYIILILDHITWHFLPFKYYFKSAHYKAPQNDPFYPRPILPLTTLRGRLIICLLCDIFYFDLMKIVTSQPSQVQSQCWVTLNLQIITFTYYITYMVMVSSWTVAITCQGYPYRLQHGETWYVGVCDFRKTSTLNFC